MSIKQIQGAPQCTSSYAGTAAKSNVSSIVFPHPEANCIVAEDIRKTVGEKKLWITDYSRKLFQAVSNLEISENPKEEAKKGEYVFQELETLDTDDEQIEQFIIYRWNRVYPADVSVEIGAEWKLTETEEFPGFSHEKITKEIYCRE